MNGACDQPVRKKAAKSCSLSLFQRRWLRSRRWPRLKQSGRARPPGGDRLRRERRAAGGHNTFSRAELEKLLAPIALYSDPLLAQLLPASAYPVQIVQAQRWLGKNKTPVANNDYSGIDNQNWMAVKALARFPDVIKKMSEDLDWTTDLGDAEVNQPQDVADVIQELRAKAQQNDTLKTTAQQTVTTTQQTVTTASGGALKRLTLKSSRPIRRRSTSPPTTRSRSMSPIPASRLSWASGPASRSARCGTTTTGTGDRARSIRRTGPAIRAGEGGGGGRQHQQRQRQYRK